jgi:GT2 family glycosyltransferase
MISVVVPVWNGRDLLARLMATLTAQTQPAGELLVIDNGSTDGAPELARREGARVIPMGRNAGFAAAVNRGIAESRGDRIAVLNSDVELAPDYLALLAAADGWFATGKILRRGDGAAGTIDGTFDAVCRGGAAWRVGSGRPDGPAFSSPRSIASPPWTAVLFRAEIFRRAGALEESFESYLEDVDFGLRCARLGLTGCYVPAALAWHRGSATLGRWHPDTVRRIARNQILLLARHYPGDLLLRYCWPILVAQLLWGALALRHGRTWAWLRGVCQGIGDFRGAREKSQRFLSGRPQHLRDNEDLIRGMQASTGFDTYWRLYFLLTCPKSGS